MRFRGLFCGGAAANNEEYRKILKRRNWWYGAIALAGALVAGVALAAFQNEGKVLPDYILGVYCGFGTGLILGMAILLVRNLILLGNEEKLKQSRLENCDERLEQISFKASQSALKVLILVGVAAGLVGGIYEPVLIRAMIFMLDVFVFSWLIACAYYKKKM